MKKITMFMLLTLLSLLTVTPSFANSKYSQSGRVGWQLDSDNYYYFDLSEVNVSDDKIASLSQIYFAEYYDINSSEWIRLDTLGTITSVEMIIDQYDDFLMVYAYFMNFNEQVIDKAIYNAGSIEEIRNAKVLRYPKLELPPRTSEWISDNDGYQYFNIKENIADLIDYSIGIGRISDDGIIIMSDYMAEDEILEYIDVNGNWRSDYNGIDTNGFMIDWIWVDNDITITLTFISAEENPLEYYIGTLTYDITLDEARANKKYFRKINPLDIPGENITDINDLPLTLATEDQVKLGTVLYDVEGLNVTIQITYESKVYYLEKRFTVETDMAIFDTIESYYMNVDGNPQIIINHSDRPYLRDILEAPADEKPAFVPHTIWDLKTDKIKTVTEYKTNVYIKQNEKGVMIAYMYIDEFIMDRLLSAHLTWNSYTEKSYLWGLIPGGYSDLVFHEEILTSDGYLTYRNLSTHWTDYVPIWSLYRGIYNDIKTYQMPEIDNINLSNPQSDYNVTKNELETYFATLNKDFHGIKDNPRYKVWGLGLQEGADSIRNTWLVGTKKKTYVYHNSEDLSDPNNLKIISLKYETNGKLYEAVGNDMDLIISGHPDDIGVPPEKTNLDIKTIVIIALIVIPYLYILSKNRGFSKFENFIRITIIYALIVVAVLFVYRAQIAKTAILYHLRL